MASIQFVVNATDAASGVFEKIGLAADGLDKQLEDLGKRVAAPEVNLEDSKFTLGMINAAKRLDKLNAMVADPEVKVDTAALQTEILRINAMLDRLDARRVSVEVGVNQSFMSRLKGVFGAGGGGIGGLFGAGASAAGGGAQAGGGGLAALGPYAQGGAIAAAIAAAVSLAPAAIPVGIGGLAGLGAIGGGLFGAAQGKKVLTADLANIKQVTTALAGAVGQQKQQLSAALKDANKQYAKDSAFYAPFTALQGALKGLAQNLLAPLRPVMAPLTKIIEEFGKSLAALGPTFTSLFMASLPFVKMFAQFLLQSGKILLPVFTQAMKQMTPFLPLITQGLVALVQGFADMVKAMGPRGMEAAAKTFVALMKATGAILTVTGKLVNFFAVAVQDVAHWIQQHWKIVEWLAAPVVTAVTLIIRHWADLRHQTAVIFDGVRHDIAHVWDQIYSNTIGAVLRFGHDVLAKYDAIRAGIYNTLNHLPGQLWNLAKTALENIVKGAESVVPRIKSWFSGFASGIVHIFKNIWGWFSPSAVMFQGGKSLMEGLAQGIKSHEHQAVAAAAAAAHRVANAGSGVQRWAGLVSQALRMEGLSPGLAGNVLYQMSTESGGNPNAINNWDINAQRGDPSRGLMQVIGSTFAAYHWPGTSMNIYDPLANIAAALNYARHVYGPSLMSGGMGIGSGHGYDAGGWLPTGLSLAWNNTGRPERVLGPGEGGNVYVTVNAPVGSNPAEIGRQVATVLAEFKKRGGMIYAPGGF
jgi:SLT domain-containing protein